MSAWPWPRAAFIARLRALLAPHNIEAHSAELGFDQHNNRSAWVLGLTLPNRSVTTVNVAVYVGTAMSNEACDDIANRVANWVAQQAGASPEEVLLGHLRA